MVRNGDPNAAPSSPAQCMHQCFGRALGQEHVAAVDRAQGSARDALHAAYNPLPRMLWYGCGGGGLTGFLTTLGLWGAQRSDDQQFLFETTVEAGVTETVKEMVEVHNLRLRIQR